MAEAVVQGKATVQGRQFHQERNHPSTVLLKVYILALMRKVKVQQEEG